MENGDACVFGGDGFADGDDRGGKRRLAFDAEAGLAREIDGDWQDWQAERAEGSQVDRRDVTKSGVAGGGAAGDENQDAAVGEVGFELASGGFGCGVVGGEHRAGAGFLQVAAEGGVIVGRFLDEPGDFAAGEEFFEIEQELEIKPAGNDQAARRRKALLVKDLDGSGRHFGNRLRG